MSIPAHPPETDLLVPIPGPGEHWDPHIVHTHYFGFTVPEELIGVFLYIRYQPEHRSSHGGVAIFQGTDNIVPTDIEHIDYQIAMGWPVVDGNTITTDNGLRIEFVELGRVARLTYTSADGAVSLDVVAEAVTPLVARGHIMPGEEDHHHIIKTAGGSEQFMHVTGEMTLRGNTYAVDCYHPRDRSWNQVRAETYVPTPPLGWTPMYFGPDLVLNQIGFEPLDTNPTWAGLYDVGERPSHHFGWIQRGDETRTIKWVRRNVLEHHRLRHIPMRQELTIEDESGEVYRFQGETLACAPLPQWPNVVLHDAVCRWTDESGRATCTTFQGLWMADYQHAMTKRALAAHTS